VNKTRDTHLRRTAVVFDRPMLLVAATLTLLCLSNAFLCVQSQRLRTELLHLRSTVSAVEARPVDHASQASAQGGNAVFASRGK